MRAGPGFISLQGPRGVDGLITPMFPLVTKLTTELNTETEIQEATLAAVRGDGKHGDIYITPSGMTYTLDVINGTPVLSPLWNIAGADGDRGPDGAVPPSHAPGTSDHDIQSPIKYIPGNYDELKVTPSVTIKPFPATP